MQDEDFWKENDAYWDQKSSHVEEQGVVEEIFVSETEPFVGSTVLGLEAFFVQIFPSVIQESLYRKRIDGK